MYGFVIVALFQKIEPYTVEYENAATCIVAVLCTLLMNKRSYKHKSKHPIAKKTRIQIENTNTKQKYY